MEIGLFIGFFIGGITTSAYIIWFFKKIKKQGYIKTEGLRMEDSERKEILETYNWIKVKKYKDDNSLSCEERYQKLEAHHIEETTFLINKIREIVKDN